MRNHIVRSLVLGALVVAPLSACPAPTAQEIPIPGGLRLDELPKAVQQKLRATIAVSDGGLSETEVPLHVARETISGTFTMQNAEAAGERTLTLRVYGRIDADADEVLLGRASTRFSFTPGEASYIAFDKGQQFDICGTRGDGTCALDFDDNRNERPNIDDLHDGIDPAPQPLALEISPSTLQFPSGIRLGDFARQVVILENLSDHALRLERLDVIDAPGVGIALLSSAGDVRGTPRRSLSGDALDVEIAPRAELLLAVSFAPTNSYLATGAVQAVLTDVVSGVRQGVRTKVIANSDGELKPADGSLAIPDDATVTTGDGALTARAFPSGPLSSGLALTSDDPSSDSAGLRFGAGATVSLALDGDNARDFVVDAAFLVDVPPGYRLSTALGGLATDVDLALVHVEADALGALACSTPADCLSQNASTSDEAIELENTTDDTLSLAVLLSRIAAKRPARAVENALVDEGESAPFELIGRVHRGPEFADDTPLDPAHGPVEGGNTVTLRGRGFQSGATVTFAGFAALDVSYDVDDPNDTVIVCTAPIGSLEVGKNPATIVVENPAPADGGDGQAATLPEAYLFDPPAPRLENVAPSFARADAPDEPVTLTGLFFSKTFGPPVVRFGEQAVDGAFVPELPGALVVLPPPSTTPNASSTVSLRVHNRIAPDIDSDDDGVPDAPVLGLSSNVLVFSYVVPDGAPPELLSVAPDSGSIDGGEPITLTGREFRDGAVVRFGDALVEDTVLGVDADDPDLDTLSFLSPAGDDGAVIDITVLNRDAQSDTLEAAFTYLTPEPVLTSVTPSRVSAAGGAVLILAGAGFRDGAVVELVRGGERIAADGVTVASSSAIVALAPAADADTWDLTVTNPNGLSASVPLELFTPSGPPPSIESVLPPSGSELGGTAVRVVVANLDAAATVTVGATSVPAAFVPPGTEGLPSGIGALDLVTPPSSFGQGVAFVQVINEDGQSDAASFLYTEAPVLPGPDITDVAPRNLLDANQLQSVVVVGAHLADVSVVSIDNLDLVIDEANDDVIYATADLSLAYFAPGLHTLRVQTGAGADTFDVFFVSDGGGTGGSTAPVIDWLSPQSVWRGDGPATVVVAGQNLGAAWFALDEQTMVPAEEPPPTDSQVAFVVDADLLAHGAHLITATSALDPTLFDVAVLTVQAYPPPALYGTSPSTLLAGEAQVVTFWGSGFVVPGPQGESALFINGAQQTNAAVTWSNTIELPAFTPPIGPFLVEVRNPDGQSASMTAVGVEREPRISILSPSAATLGTGVRTIGIYGSGFTSALVRLDNTGLAINEATRTDDYLEVDVDMDAIEPGVHLFEVDLWGVSDFAAFDAQEGEAPRITAASPSHITLGYSSTVLVTGTGLGNVDQVLFDGAPVAGFTNFGASISVTILVASFPGPGVLELRSSDGQSDSIAIERRDAPVINGISSTRAHTNGGDVLTVYGANLDADPAGPMLQIQGPPFDQNLSPISGTLTSSSFSVRVLAGLDAGPHNVNLLPGAGFASQALAGGIAAEHPRVTSVATNENAGTVDLFLHGDGLIGQVPVAALLFTPSGISCPTLQQMGDEIRCTIAADQLRWGRQTTVQLDYGYGSFDAGTFELPPRNITGFVSDFDGNTPALPALVDLAQQSFTRRHVRAAVSGLGWQNLSNAATLVIDGVAESVGTAPDFPFADTVRFSFSAGTMAQGSFGARIVDEGVTVASASSGFDAVAPSILGAPSQLVWNDTPASASIDVNGADYAKVIARHEALGTERDVTSFSQNGNPGVEIEVAKLAVERWRFCLESPTGEVFGCASVPTAVVAPSGELEANNNDGEATAIGLIPGESASGLVSGALSSDPQDRFFVFAAPFSLLRVNVLGASQTDCASGNGASLRVRARGSSAVVASSTSGVGSSTCAQLGLDQQVVLDEGEYVIELSRAGGTGPSYQIVAAVAPPREPSCGDGVATNGEDFQCENGAAPLCPFSGQQAACDADNCVPDFSTCPTVSGSCGDGVVGVNEQCDGADFNPAGGVQPGSCNGFFGGSIGVVRCLPSCIVDGSLCMTGAVCGNGVVEGNEQCDDMNADPSDGCSPECLLSQCGDGRLQAGELCDDGNLVNGDTCNDRCAGP